MVERDTFSPTNHFREQLNHLSMPVVAKVPVPVTLPT
jgi:hypothetical protein